MDYRPTWNLTTIPDDIFKREYSRRTREKRTRAGRYATCDCGECPKCKNRERMRQFRVKERSK